MKSGDSLDVLLSVTGENRSPGGDEPETIRVVTLGTLLRLDEGWELKYIESDPDGNGSQKVVITLTDGRVVMERAGDFSTTMVFEKGRRFDGAYRTPWGDLAMGIYTVQVNTSFGEEQASLRLVYQVDIQGRFTAMHDLTLRFAPNE